MNNKSLTKKEILAIIAKHDFEKDSPYNFIEKYTQPYDIVDNPTSVIINGISTGDPVDTITFYPEGVIVFKLMVENSDSLTEDGVFYYMTVRIRQIHSLKFKPAVSKYPTQFI